MRQAEESEQEQLARLRREKAELVKHHAKDKAAWEERAKLEDERDDAPMLVKLQRAE